MRLATWLLPASLLLSGCSGDDASSDPNRPLGVASDGLGVVRGLVIDEELSPVEGALVELELELASATTDLAGRFNFSGLRPGTYSLFVTKHGFAQAEARFEIAEEEITEVRVGLVAVPTDDPYVTTQIFNGYIRAGNAIVDATVLSFGMGGLCEACLFPFWSHESGKSIQIELLFKPSTPDPTAVRLGWQVWNYTKSELATDISGVYGGGYLASGQKAVLHNEKLANKWKDSGEHLRLIQYCDVDWVCLEQRWQAFVSISYREIMRDDFSALPDS